MNKGFSIHCHHNILVEYCYDYQERVEAIKRDKPKHEQEIRLRLFKLLPKEALEDLPLRLQKADAERRKADAEYEKAYAERNKVYAERNKADAERRKVHAEYEKTYAERNKAYAERNKAYAEWNKAYAEWTDKDQEAFHKKWCGCKNYKNGKIDFSMKKGE